MCLLMFADDVVVLESSAEALRQTLRVVWEYSQRWRFRFNFGKDKSAVMVVGGGTRAGPHLERDLAGEEWRVGSVVMQRVTSYRYLGVRFTNDGKWATRRVEAVESTRRSMWRAWGLGLGGGMLSSKGAAGLFESLVQPVAEYGAEIVGGAWGEMEKVQLLAGRLALGVGNEVANEVVRGELGWGTMRSRRDYLRLSYWGNIVRNAQAGPSGRGLVGSVYEEGRRRADQGATYGKWGWSKETKRLLQELGLGGVWVSQEVGAANEWHATIRHAIGVRGDREWRWSMVQGGTKVGGIRLAKVKLREYMEIKRGPKKEWWLTERRWSVSRWVRLRAGVAKLEEEEGRWKGTPRWRRRCRMCDSGEVADGAHHVDRCQRWAAERARLWEEVEAGDPRMARIALGWGYRRRVRWLLRGGGGKKTRVAVFRQVVQMLAARERLRGGVIGRGRRRRRGGGGRGEEGRRRARRGGRA